MSAFKLDAFIMLFLSLSSSTFRHNKVLAFYPLLAYLAESLHLSSDARLFEKDLFLDCVMIDNEVLKKKV